MNWKIRSQLVHKRSLLQWDVIFGHAIKYFNKFLTHKVGFKVMEGENIEPNFPILIIDASWNLNINRGSIGWIMRDYSGRIIQTAHKCIKFSWSIDLM